LYTTFDDFDGNDINDGWFEGIAGTFDLIDPANSEQIHGGAGALKAVYDKG